MDSHAVSSKYSYLVYIIALRRLLKRKEKKNEIIVSEVNKKNKKKTLRKEYKSHGRGYKRGLLGVQ